MQETYQHILDTLKAHGEEPLYVFLNKDWQAPDMGRGSYYLGPDCDPAHTYANLEDLMAYQSDAWDEDMEVYVLFPVPKSLVQEALRKAG